MSGELGTEAIKGLFVTLQKLVEDGMEVMEDGKLSFGDLSKVPALYSDVSKLIEAYPKVLAESKDLDMNEVGEVFEAVIGLVKAIAEKAAPKV